MRWVCPGQPWDEVVRVLNHRQQIAWTIERLRQIVQRLARESVVEAHLLGNTGIAHSARMIGGETFMPVHEQSTATNFYL